MTTAGTRRRPRLTAGDRWLIGATVVALVPIVAGVVMAILDGWNANADNAYFLLRARDVGTEHTPLLGTWTSTSTAVGFDVNNPGPMLFWLLAIPVRLGESTGLLVGVAVLNAAAVVGIAWALRRSAGAAVAMIGLVGVTGLGWSMGRTMLVDPWQPHSLMHAALLFLVLVWVSAAGDRWALPFTVGVASLLVQTHVSYVYLVVALGLVAVVGLVWNTLVTVPGTEGDSEDDSPAGGRWRHVVAVLRAPVLVSVVVGIVCWVPSLVEQYVVDGRGNLGRLLEASGADVATVGAGTGTRITAGILVAWPTWMRDSFYRRDLLAHAPGTGVATVALLALVVALVALAWWALRRHDRFVATGCVVAIGAVAGSVFSAGNVLATDLGTVTHHFRFLWPVAVLVQLVIVVGLVRLLAPKATVVLAVAGAVVVVLAVWNLPHLARKSYDESVVAAPAVEAMQDQLGALDGRGPVLLDVEGRPFSERFVSAVFAELDRRDIDFLLAEESETRQIGPGRLDDGSAELVARFAWGVAALDVGAQGPPEGELVVFVTALDDDQLTAWRTARTALATALTAGDLAVTDTGRDAIARGDLDVPVTGDVVDPAASPLLLADPAFLAALDAGWIEAAGVEADVVDDWVELSPLLAVNTFAMWVVPGSAT